MDWITFKFYFEEHKKTLLLFLPIVLFIIGSVTFVLLDVTGASKASGIGLIIKASPVDKTLPDSEIRLFIKNCQGSIIEHLVEAKDTHPNNTVIKFTGIQTAVSDKTKIQTMTIAGAGLKDFQTRCQSS